MGHPFLNATGAGYWSSTAFAWLFNSAWAVSVYNGDLSVGGHKSKKNNLWPLRSGQFGFGSLKGNVTDLSNNTFINNIIISVKDKTTQANELGYYILRLAPGVYDVTFSETAYETFTVRNIVITEGKITELNVQLQAIEVVSTPSPSYRSNHWYNGKIFCIHNRGVNFESRPRCRVPI